MDARSGTSEHEELAEENKRLKIEIKKLTRQLNLANDNMRKYKNVTSAKENLSAVISAEKSMRDKQLQVIIDNSPDIVILLDSSMNFMVSTQRFINLAGITSSGFLHNKSFRQVFSSFEDDEWLARMEGIFRKALKTKEIQTFDEKIRIGAPGNARKYAVSVISFNYGGDANVGLLLNFHDLTERIEMEDRLKEALIKATAASKAKSEFLSNMSHEIRTPMNAIIGMTAIGNSASTIERKDSCFAKINDASKHLLGIINNILDMAKIEAGKLELSSAEFDLKKTLQQIINVFSFVTDEKQQKVTVRIDGNIPEILIGDDQRLSQVIANLLENAIKFTPTGGAINLYASLAEEKDGVCKIKITVEDTGIGISPEQQRKLFQSFQQAESSTTRKFGGTGLGLAISKNIVETMGGKIWVESGTEKGSVFVFTILAKRGGERKESLTEAHVNRSGLNGNFAGCHILLAEDVEINREIVVELLRPMCVEIDCAENGKEAVRMFSEAPDKYEIIFMDVQMPEMDGYEATRAIRELDTIKARNIPIIAMTANVFKEDIEKCLAAGMNGHVGKPLNLDEMVRTLEKYLIN